METSLPYHSSISLFRRKPGPCRSATFIVKRWEHHTPSGGYDRLAQEMDGMVVKRTVGSGLKSRLEHLLWRICRKTSLTTAHLYLLDYRYEDWLAEWRLVLRARLNRTDVVHCLYGDEQLDLLLRRRWLLPCPLVATFHLPTDRDYVKARFERFQKHLLGGIDAAIVVARSQLPDFQRWLGPERVVYIPHGIDTKRFCPGAIKGDQGAVRLLTVGDHLRDWNALHRIIDRCSNLKLPTKFDVVVREMSFPYLTGCANVRLLSEISEDQLITLYREADVLLLPLTDGTANNAVLEAMACGTPVISTNVGGIPDYVDRSAGWLFAKGEVDLIVKLIKTSCENKNVFLSLREGARANSVRFDWQRIRRRLFSVYESVCTGQSLDLCENMSN